jgi:hypothetical protein
MIMCEGIHLEKVKVRGLDNPVHQYASFELMADSLGFTVIVILKQAEEG